MARLTTKTRNALPASPFAGLGTMTIEAAEHLGRMAGSIFENPFWSEYPNHAKTVAEECFARHWVDGYCSKIGA